MHDKSAYIALQNRRFCNVIVYLRLYHMYYLYKKNKYYENSNISYLYINSHITDIEKQLLSHSQELFKVWKYEIKDSKEYVFFILSTFDYDFFYVSLQIK